jgi:hypothetical protein
MNIKNIINRMKNSDTIMMAESIFFAIIAMFAIVPMATIIASIIEYFFN